jgi:hypothetical protein
LPSDIKKVKSCPNDEMYGSREAMKLNKQVLGSSSQEPGVPKTSEFNRARTLKK